MAMACHRNRIRLAHPCARNGTLCGQQRMTTSGRTPLLSLVLQDPRRRSWHGRQRRESEAGGWRKAQRPPRRRSCNCAWLLAARSCECGRPKGANPAGSDVMPGSGPCGCSGGGTAPSGTGFGARTSLGYLSSSSTSLLAHEPNWCRPVLWVLTLLPMSATWPAPCLLRAPPSPLGLPLATPPHTHTHMCSCTRRFGARVACCCLTASWTRSTSSTTGCGRARGSEGGGGCSRGVRVCVPGIGPGGGSDARRMRPGLDNCCSRGGMWGGEGTQEFCPCVGLWA